MCYTCVVRLLNICSEIHHEYFFIFYIHVKHVQLRYNLRGKIFILKIDFTKCMLNMRLIFETLKVHTGRDALKCVHDLKLYNNIQ